MQDNYQEVTIIVIAGAILFVVFAGVIIFFIFLNQKKKFQHSKDILTINEKFKAEILNAQLEIQEQTFNHISQEIHDNVGQILSLAKVQINIMNESEDMNREMLNEVKQNIGKAMIDLRDIAKSLNSDHIRALNIHSAVSNEAARLNKSGIVHVDVLMEGAERKINEQRKLILFRIIQEGMQNIIKHAGASDVSITFQYLPGSLQTIIKDNGKGFDLENAPQNYGGLGLANIKNRSSLIGATSNIESFIGKGTTITINIPYE
ncbi:MAG TPA: ATP-binding protein [Chitinophagaceae bacterium]|nr:ATP-binding protein [Chitinophagaceae bacterium]